MFVYVISFFLAESPQGLGFYLLLVILPTGNAVNKFLT